MICKRFFLRITGAFGVAAFVMATPVHAQPLADELRRLLVEHPTLNSGRSSVDSADRSRAAARSAYYPLLSLSADGGPEKITTSSYNNGTPTTPATSDLTRRRASPLP